MSIVVIGTDTEVGKTLVSGLVLSRYASGRRLGYWKPVATGASDAGEESDRERVSEWVGDRIDVLPETYRFGPPVSPHLAARWAGVRIDPERILEELVRHGLDDPERNLVIEGIGGVFVPLTDSGYLLVHLLSELHLPCLLVARSTLGTINHTLLTLEALRARSIEVLGVVLSGPQSSDNRDAVVRFGEVDVLDEVDLLPRLDRETVVQAATGFDARGALAQYFE